MTRIETERLVLREPREDDLDALARFYADPEVMRFIGAGKTRTREESAESLRNMLRWRALDGFGMFICERREDATVIGRSGLLVWDTRVWQFGSRAELGEHAEVELGWTLGREFWGHGYATEAARAARDWAFGELGLSRLISLIHPENAPSIRVAERLGCTVEREVETGTFGPARIYIHPVP